ncbi:proteasomal ubiquitin receptor ADRM1-like [Saccoglossus kowalevskii]|uniref:Proteasomal ubiquitin receptor ADRM1-like n=1 Tax=Saccoglossus kowalevskii TaxID=10224 RepID=A0ABM0GNB7_SACKO|nr:PREDICTED: proteasomal ubiquitin receptor ADRM1-like [Saccoglossus kowalevskii]
MASGALFGSAATGGRSGSKNLVEFRAGKMYLKGTTVTPDKRKGLLYIHQSDDSLVHFCWKDRTTGSVEDDLIIFPDDCEFKRVPQCTTGRVYILKFKSSSRKFFFWLQEPKTDKDEDNCEKVNEYLNNPPPPGTSSGSRSGGIPPELSALGGEGGLGMLGNMDQQQLMQLLGGGGLSALGGMGGLGGLGSLLSEGRASSAQSTSSSVPSRVQSSPGGQRPTSSSRTASGTGTASSGSGTTTSQSQQRPATAAAALPTQSPRQPIQLSELQNILGTMNIPANEGNQGHPSGTNIDLSQAISPEVMAPILSNPDIRQRLIQHLPEGESLPQDSQQLNSTLQSSQFKQAMSLFGAALQSGQLGPLMGQFGLNQGAVDAANKGDLEAFVGAMQSKDSKEQDKKKNSGKDDDDAMSLD